jgi:hypothetical protein
MITIFIIIIIRNERMINKNTLWDSDNANPRERPAASWTCKVVRTMSSSVIPAKVPTKYPVFKILFWESETR